jgi:hypothetical protein
MANNANQRQSLALKLEGLTESEVGEVLDYVSLIESTRRSPTTPLNLDDDTVAALVDARENRRARQAFEWESVRRKADRRAAANR